MIIRYLHELNTERWIAFVPEVPDCHTDPQSSKQEAYEQIIELLTFYLGKTPVDLQEIEVP